MLSLSIKRKLRIVASSGISERKLYRAVIPDEIYIVKGKHKKRVRGAVVIDRKTDYDGYKGIVPASLLR